LVIAVCLSIITEAAGEKRSCFVIAIQQHDENLLAQSASKHYTAFLFFHKGLVMVIEIKTHMAQGKRESE
jgi:hypothetical protein